jgi:hypothetical protein
MTHSVTVSFAPEREYEILLHDSDAAAAKDEARSWLAKEFEELECSPTNPMGKVLVLDMILNIAKYSGEERFKQGGEWSQSFGAAVAGVLQRPAVKVDVADFVVR